MLVVAFLTVVTLWIAERNVARNAAGARRRAFEQMAALQQVRTIRRAALTERCRSLVHRPRIHAALEDDALDLLYPSANEEMRDVMSPEDPPQGRRSVRSRHVSIAFWMRRALSSIHQTESQGS